MTSHASNAMTTRPCCFLWWSLEMLLIVFLSTFLIGNHLSTLIVVSGEAHDAVTIPTDRNALGRFVNRLDFKRGAVVHVLSDEAFALHLLADWSRCQYLAIVFPSFRATEKNNYEKLYYEKTKDRIVLQTKAIAHARHPHTHLVFTTEDASPNDHNSSSVTTPLDFVYIHFQVEDYCVAEELLKTWWERLSPRGILSGFHFVDDQTQTKFLREYQNVPPDDWVFCDDHDDKKKKTSSTRTTRRAGLVREAVAKFAAERNCAVFTTTEQDILHSFFIQKPS
jgi:hypothetical protein